MRIRSYQLLVLCTYLELLVLDLDAGISSGSQAGRGGTWESPIRVGETRTEENQDVLTAVPCHSHDVKRDSWVPNAVLVDEKIGLQSGRAGGREESSRHSSWRSRFMTATMVYPRISKDTDRK